MWGSANFTRMNGTSAPADSAPALESPGTPDSNNEWDSEDQGTIPPEDESIASTVDDPDGTGPLLVNTTTGELVGAGV